MKISNYDTDIVDAVKSVSEDVRLLYEKSDDILGQLMNLKSLSKEENGINELPDATLTLTQECVSILQDIETRIGASHQLYILQSAKLYNIITHASEQWARMWMENVREHKANGTSDDETNSSLNTIRKCYKAMEKLTFLGDFKSEYEQSCIDMHVEKVCETPLEVQQKSNEIQRLCQEMVDIAKAIEKLGPSSYKTPKIQWTGGIGGLIYDKVQRNKIDKMAKAPLYKDYTFENLGRKYILEYTTQVVNLQLDIQKEVPSNNPLYYDNVRMIYSAIENVLIAWHNYCPDVANIAIAYDNDGNYVTEFSQLAGQTKHEFLKMDLPSDMQSLREQPKHQKQSSGCFGVFIFLLGLSGGLLYFLMH